MRITPGTPVHNTNFSYDPAGPWDLVIEPVTRTVRVPVKFKNPQDLLPEAAETVSITGTATALNESLPVSATSFGIAGSDQLTVEWGFTGARGRNSGGTHEFRVWAQLNDGVIPTTGSTLTVTPDGHPDWFSPGSLTFTWDGDDIGKTCPVTGIACRQEKVWTVEAPTLQRRRTIDFSETASGVLRTIRRGTQQLLFYPTAGEPRVVRDLDFTYPRGAWPGNVPWPPHHPFHFEVEFDRRISTERTPTVPIILDSGPVDASCSFLPETPHLLRCTFRPGPQRYDVDRLMQVRAGSLNLGTTISNPDDADEEWAAPTIPATNKEFRTGSRISGTGHTFEATATVQEGFREGGGEQILEVLISDVGQKGAASDISIPIRVTNGTTTSGDWKVIREGVVTIARGRREGTGQMTIEALLDGVTEGDETLLVGGASDTYQVLPDELVLVDAPELVLTVDPVSAEEGTDTAVKFRIALEEGAAALGKDLGPIIVLFRGDAVAGLEGSGADFDVIYPDPLNPFLTLPAGQRFVEETRTISAWADHLVEGDEIIRFEGNLPFYTVRPAEFTIVDANSMPDVVLSVSPESVSEGGGAQEVSVSAALADEANLLPDEVVITLDLSGSATAGLSSDDERDYTPTWSPSSKELRIPANATGSSQSARLTVTPLDDTMPEGTERITVQGRALRQDSARTELTVQVANVVLEDNDARGVHVEPTALTLQAGTSGDYRVNLNSLPTLGAGEKVRIEPILPASALVTATSQVEFDATDWMTPKDVTVTANPLAAGDTVTITHRVGGGDYASVTAASVVVTVSEPPELTLSLDASSISENGGVATVTGALDRATTVPFSVTVSATENAPTVAADFTLSANAVLTFASGSTASTGTVTITANDNDFYIAPPNAEDPPEPKTVTISGTLSGHLGIGQPEDLTLEISDDDTMPTFSIADASGSEEDEEISFTVSRGGAAANPVEVKWMTALDTGEDAVAASASDFTAVTTAQSLSFAADVTEVTLTVAVDNDDLDEPAAETFLIQLSEPSEIAEIAADGGEATGTIQDDDDPPSFSIADASAAEGEEITFTVARGGATENVATVKIATADDGTEDANPAGADDYSAISSAVTLDFPSGVTSVTQVVQTTEDDLDEPDETFLVVLSEAALAEDDPGTGVTIPEDGGTATGTITDDDDDAPTGITLTAAPDSIGEEDEATAVVVTAAVNGTTRYVDAKTVTVSVAGDTASTSDFAAVEDFTITIAAGAASGTGTFTLTPADDVLDEPDETVEVTGESGTLTITSDEITITDDDDAPTGITLTAAPDEVGEEGGATAITVTATVNGTTRYVDAKTVTVSVDDGTATSPADYAAVADFTITIAAGAASGTGSFTLTPVDDVLDEPDETIAVTGASGALTITSDEITIADDDATPSFAVSDGEGEEGDGIAFVVTRSGATGNAVSVQWATALASGAGAASAADFTAVTATTLSFAASETTRTVTVATTDDLLAEGDETFEVRLSGAAKADGDPGAVPTITAGTGIGTIEDDDAAPTGITLTAAPDSIGEEDEATAVVVTAAVNGTTRYVDAKTVTVSVDDGTATSPADYAAVTDFTITIAAGAASGTGSFTLTPVNDVLDEPDETIAVTGTSGALTITSDEITIADDDATPTGITLTAAPDEVGEEDGATAITVTAAVNGTTRYVDAKTVTVSVDDGTATSPADYAAVTDFTITIAAGAASGTGSFTLTPVDDVLDEPNETVAVTGTSSAITITSDEITITDDDATLGGITLTAAPDSVDEDDGATAITVTATVNGTTRYADAKAVTVSVGGGTTSATDYGAVTAFTITIPANTASATGTFTLTPINDSVAEGSETLDVTGSSDVTVTRDTITIADNDATPGGITLTAAPDSVGEEDGATAITVTAAVNGTTRYVDAKTVTVSVDDDSATSPADYAAVTDFAITIAAGAASGTGTFTLTPMDDALDEPNETVDVTGTSGALTITGDEITIADDDAKPGGITLTAAPDSVDEDDGATAVTVTAAVNGTTRYVDAKTVTVSVGGGTATATTDYGAVTAFTITIPANTASATGTFTLTPIDDSVAEGSETLDVTGSSDVTVTKDEITIADDDATPGGITLTAAPDSVDEDDGATAITVTAAVNGTTRYADAKAVTVSVGGGTTSATDYGAVTAFTITIPANTASATGTFTLTPIDDSVAEGSETLDVTGSSDVTVTKDEITIADDDATPGGITLTAAPDSVNEDAGATEITVTAAVNGTTRYPDQKTVTVSVDDDSATSPADYAAVTDFTITIAAGAASGTGSFTLTPVDDSLDEPDETIDVTGTSAGFAVTSDVITIADDDGTVGATLSVDPAIVGEDAGATTVAVAATVDGDPRTEETELTISVAAGTAQAADFHAVQDFTLTIAAGAASGTTTFTLTPVNDLIADDQETIIVSGTTTVVGYTVTSATITLNNFDPPANIINLSVDPVSVAEDGGDQEVEVTARYGSGHRGEDTGVVVSVAGDTASADDFSAVTAFTVTIAAGEPDATGTFTFSPVDDALHEGSETVEITGTTTVADLTVNPASLELTDDDEAPDGITLTATPDEVDEDAGATTITVTAAVNSATRFPDARTVTVSVDDDSATSPADYAAVSDFTITIAANAASGTGTFTLTPADDAVEESSETLTVSGTSGAIPVSSATIAIHDREPLIADNRMYEFELPEGASGPRNVGDVEEPQDPEPKTHVLLSGDTRRFDVGLASGIVFYIGAGEDYETGPRSFDMEVDVENGPLGRVAVAQVRVNVTDVPEPPEPRNDAVTTPEDTPVLIAVLENDSDPDGDELTIVAVSVPGNGTARIVGDRIRYRPDENWYGLDSFTYTVSDPSGLEATALVRVTVTPVNDPPEAEDDRVTTPEDTSTVIAVLENDSDVDGDEIRIVAASAPGDGTAQVVGGRIRYHPDENWYGQDSFTYTVSDPDGLKARATIRVTVTPVNDGPGPEDDRVTTPEDIPVLIAALENDTDLDGDELRIVAVSAPANGSATIVEDRIRYSPDENWYGLDSFTYTVADPGGLEGTALVRVTVTPVNDPPEARDDEVETLEDHSVLIAVLDNDSDVDGDALRLVSATAGNHGRTALAGDGLLLYTPERDWFGVDTFTYRISDPGGLEDTATVTVTVWPVNDAPYPIGAVPAQHVEEGGVSTEVDLPPYFGDVDDLTLRYEAVSSNLNAVTVTVSGTTLTLIPVVTGDAVITVTATDAGGLSARQRFAVIVGDELIKAALTDVFAGMGRAHLSSLRSTLGRRLVTGSATNRFNVAGQYLSADRFGQVGLGGLQQTQEMAFGAAGWEQSRRSAALGGSLTNPEQRPELAGQTNTVGLGSFGAGGEGRWLQSTDLLLSFGGQDEDEEARAGRRWTVWGQGDLQSFRGEREVASTYDADLRTAYLGLDLRVGEKWLVGVAGSRSLGSAEWQVGASGGGLETAVTSVHPYLRWGTEETAVWAVGGFGHGDARGERGLTGLEDASSLDLALGLLEGRHRLATTRFGLGVNLRGAASRARLGTGPGEETVDELSATVQRLRTGVELDMQFTGPGEITLAPFTALSTLHDAGDGPNGVGLEVAGGLRLNAATFRLEAQGRRLILHTAEDYEEQGFSLNASFGGGHSQAGWNASLRQRWGASGHGAETLWQERFSPADQQQGFGPSSDGVDGRLGYGLPVGASKMLSAFGGYGRMRDSRRVELGLNLGGIGLFGLGPDNPVLVEFAGERYDAGGLAPDYRMRLYGIVRFGGQPPSQCDPGDGPCPSAADRFDWRRDRTELTPTGGPSRDESDAPPTGSSPRPE